MSDGHGERRLGDDGLILEMHGMLSKLMERLENHVQWDERVHAESDAALKILNARIEPIEEFHTSMRTATKVGAVVATPALLAIGAGLWEWVRGIFSHSKVP